MKGAFNKMNNSRISILNRKYYRCVLFCFVVFSATCNSGFLFAQQDPQYSQYMFNQLAINPAYAGSKEVISTAAFIRSQWTGFEGAPTTQTITVHGPMRKKKVGLGFTIINDKVGPQKSIGFLGSYAYRIKVRNGKLSLGLRFGVYQYLFNWNDIKYKDESENSKNQTSTVIPTADAGLYYYTNSLYAGFSATHLYNGRIVDVTSQNGEYSQVSPHYFFTLGKAWIISDKLVFNPSCMVKSANGSTTADINFSFLLVQRLWVGLSVRTGYGIVGYTQFSITDKFKLGYSYDFGFNKVGQYAGGSHEIMLSYNFNLKKPQFFSPRYF